MSDARTAVISVVGGFVGVLVGAGIAGLTAVKVADIQLQQAKMSTQASSALSMRAVLAEKAAPFFSANEKLWLALHNLPPQGVELIKDGAEISAAAAQLYPYLDGDLLNACREVSDRASALLTTETLSDQARLDRFNLYADAYKKFQIMYLRLRRSLESIAQVDVLKHQIAENWKPVQAPKEE